MASKKRRYKGIEDLYAVEEEMFSRQKDDQGVSDFAPTINEREKTNQPTLDADQVRTSRSVWMLEELEHPLNLVPNEAERHYGLALIQVMVGRFNDAIRSLSLALEAEPQHIPALNLLGELYLKTGQYEKAATNLESVIRQEPDNLSAITWLCLAHHCLNQKKRH